MRPSASPNLLALRACPRAGRPMLGCRAVGLDRTTYLSIVSSSSVSTSPGRKLSPFAVVPLPAEPYFVDRPARRAGDTLSRKTRQHPRTSYKLPARRRIGLCLPPPGAILARFAPLALPRDRHPASANSPAIPRLQTPAWTAPRSERACPHLNAVSYRTPPSVGC